MPNISGETSKRINEYLNHYVVVADSKAAAIAAGSLVLLGFALTTDSIKDATLLRVLGGTCAALAAIGAGIVLYPRTPMAGSGHIFWSHIREFPSAEHYWQSLQAQGDAAMEREYAFQNFSVSGVLQKKNSVLRSTIWTFALSCLALGAAFGVT